MNKGYFMNTHSPDLRDRNPDEQPLKGLELRSCITPDGELKLSLIELEVAPPTGDEVVVRVEAAPLNPSDIGLLLGPADLNSATQTGIGRQRTLTAKIPAEALDGLALRLDASLPVGNEGAGVVVRSGPGAAELLGKTVSVAGGGMYTQYRRLNKAQCMALDPGVPPAEGAAAFINPLTALGMVETMRREGHLALVHTAAASNLGRMLINVCRNEGIALVNVVRNETQLGVLKELGSQYVLNSESANFDADLTDVLVSTKATLCFDALTGGPLAGRILLAMERALVRELPGYSRYGSSTHKQVYMYGSLDPRPIEVPRVGMAWGIGGWLLFHFLGRVGPEATQALRDRVNAELRTTFRSEFKAEISLSDVLSLEMLREYTKRSTGSKFLINPSLDA
jgi:NADPH2:quinone reductase